MAQLLPSCSKWSLWVGKECEGEEDYGEPTLFVRSMKNDDAILFETYKRVWFTKEFKNKRLIRKAIESNCKVCLEVTCETLKAFDSKILSQCVVYLKLPKAIKYGDHIKVGSPFSETIIKLVSNETNSNLYHSDVKIR